MLSGQKQSMVTIPAVKITVFVCKIVQICETTVLVAPRAPGFTINIFFSKPNVYFVIKVATALARFLERAKRLRGMYFNVIAVLSRHLDQLEEILVCQTNLLPYSTNLFALCMATSFR